MPRVGRRHSFVSFTNRGGDKETEPPESRSRDVPFAANEHEIEGRCGNPGTLARILVFITTGIGKWNIAAPAHTGSGHA